MEKIQELYNRLVNQSEWVKHFAACYGLSLILFSKQITPYLPNLFHSHPPNSPMPVRIYLVSNYIRCSSRTTVQENRFLSKWCCAIAIPIILQKVLDTSPLNLLLICILFKPSSTIASNIKYSISCQVLFADKL